MNYQLIKHADVNILEFLPGDGVLMCEADALDMVATCGENEAYAVLIPADCLVDDFFNLRSGLAGAVLLKFSNYHIRAALLLDDFLIYSERFREMILEANRRNHELHAFHQRMDALAWLASES